MNVGFVRILCLFALLGLPVTLRGQSVEAVLRSLQERVMMIEVRDQHDPPMAEQWPGGLPAFPQEGSITSLSTALGALNAASRVFDRIKGEFVAYDTFNHQFANLIHSSSGSPSRIGSGSSGGIHWIAGGLGEPTTFRIANLNLRSVGDFNEENWREKLQLLASNVNQLKVLLWPVECWTLEAQKGHYPDLWARNQQSPDQSTNKNTLSWEIDFPNFVAGGYQQPNATIVVTEDDSVGGIRIDGIALNWHINGFANHWTDAEFSEYSHVSANFGLQVATGVRMFARRLSDVSAEPHTPGTFGAFHLFAGGAVFPYGDLTEGVASQLGTPERPFRIGNLYKSSAQPVREGNSFAFGDYGPAVIPAFEPGNPYIFARGCENAVSSCLAAIGLTKPFISGKLVSARSEVLGLFVALYEGWPPPNTYEFEIDRLPAGNNGSRIAAEVRRCYQVADHGSWKVYYDPSYHFRLLVRGVCILDCADLPITPVSSPLFEHSPGEVEITLTNKELVRVHLGRGLRDLNQTAWLGTRNDGFGWAIFHGSPSAFELLYELDHQRYGPPPYGGLTFDTKDDFDPAEKQRSGWPDRFAFYAAWTSPQLRQVRGNDVLVNITYPSAYRKELAFYWTSQISEEKDANGFYPPLSGAQPFKTVMIRNPTAGDAGTGLPTERNHLRINDAGRWHEITHSGEPPGGSTPPPDTFHFKLGTAEEGSDFERTVTVSTIVGNGSEPTKTHCAVTDTAGSESATTTTEYVYPASPYSERLEPKAITRSDGDGLKTLTFDWTSPAVGSAKWYRTLNGITWSGPESWPDNGREVQFNGQGLKSYEAEWLAGKFHEVTHAWNGNARTTTRSLNNAAYSSETATYSADFREVTRTVANEPAGRHLYNTAGTRVESIYPGDFRELTQITVDESGYSIDSKSGWGSQYQSATNSIASYARNGVPVSRTVWVNSVEVEALQGSNFTAFGAPRQLTALDGTVTQVVYNETGLHWGTVQEVQLPSGVKPSFSLDKFNRPSSVSNGFETFTYTYPEPKTINITSNADRNTAINLTGTGDLKSLTQQTGTWETLNVVPGGSSSIARFGATKSLSVDAAGTVTAIGNGMGSRGAKFDIGVANGALYTEVVPTTKDGTDAPYTIRTTYDAQGRVKLVSHPGSNGTTLQESWVYDDANRTVTYSPPVGPGTQTLTSIRSADGSTLTIWKGNADYLRYVLGTEGQPASLTLTTSIYDDSTGVGAAWREVSKETVNAQGKTTTTVPWGMTTNAVSVTDVAAGLDVTRTIANQATGDTLTLKQTGELLRSISGTLQGVNVQLNNFQWDKDRLTSIGGTIAGNPVSLSIGLDGRITSLTGPTTNQSFAYGQGPGFTLTVTDALQQTSNTFSADSVGDVTGISGAGTLTLGWETLDTASGQEVKFSIGGETTPSLTMDFDHQGAHTGKEYTGGLTESYARNGDGSLQAVTTESNGESLHATVTETPNSRTVTYPDLTIATQFFNVGLRSSVTAREDARSFIYDRMALRTETHTGGIWGGWSVEQVPDAKGRLGKWRITGPGTTREFSFEYDTHSRLWKTISPELTGTYTPHPSGKTLGSLSRGGLTTTWVYNSGLLESITNSGGALAFNYYYRSRDARFRLQNRQVSVGPAWYSLIYDNADQLRSMTAAGVRSLSYGYDSRGNRNSQSEVASHQINTLNQLQSRTFATRGFGVYGKVDPAASLKVFHPQAPLGTQVSVRPVTGEFYRWWSLPTGTGSVVDLRVEATMPDANAPSGQSSAEEKLRVIVPPQSEVFSYDGAGRLSADAFWKYTWDGASRLRRMERQPGMCPELNAASEVIEHEYDADGRRTQTTRTVTYQNPPRTKVERSRVLWAGWLQIMEERTLNGVFQDRRWFQRGADLSGTLQGAGGIGGVVAIHEEKPGLQVRTLLPVQDGLGNITGVLNAADGSVVARYDYGPYGELLGEYGEVDACPFRWQSKWLDRQTGQYFFVFRYYDPRTGRWLSRDPLGEEGGANLYAYCGNDPVNRCDPLGLSWGDTALINGGWAPIGDPYYDQAAGGWIVKMRHIVALTLDLRQNVATDSVIPLARAKRLAPYSSTWSKPLGTSSQTLLSGTGFQGVEFGDISDYIENHPGFNAQMGIYEGALMAVPGGYGFGLARGILGARLAGYAGSFLLGTGIVHLAEDGISANEAGQILGGGMAGSLFLNAGERHGVAGLRWMANTFAPQRLTLGGGMLRNPRAAEAGSITNPFSAWARKTGRAYDRRFRLFWRRYEGSSVGDWYVHSVNRRLGPNVQPDLVLINHQTKVINIHDITSRADPTHLEKGELYAKYLRELFPGYKVEYTERYWSGLENILEALSSGGEKYFPGTTRP